MRTDDEILARIREVGGEDLFCTQAGDLISVLPFDVAKPFLVDTATAADWVIESREREAVLGRAKSYMDFAWSKANGQRGLSAMRSIEHMKAWLWLAGQDELLGKVEATEHRFYGKPALVLICKALGWDWRAWDDDLWSNYQGGPYRSADDVLFDLEVAA